MSWSLAALSHRGAMRSSNEDGVCIDRRILARSTIVPEQHALNADLHLAMIADGMGGHAGGEVASRLALEHTLLRREAMFDESQCAEVIQSANDLVYSRMKEDDALAGMGTTLVGVVLSESGILSFNVGDSRCYLHGSLGLVQLTIDDSPAKSVSLSKSRGGHVVTQALGGHVNRRAITPHILSSPPLLTNERLLLCSDGLTDLVDDVAISEILEKSGDVNECAHLLNKAAMNNGGRDNISIVIIGCSG